MFVIHNRLGSEVEEILMKASAIQELSKEEAYKLIRAQGSQIPALMLAAWCAIAIRAT